MIKPLGNNVWEGERSPLATRRSTEAEEIANLQVGMWYRDSLSGDMWFKVGRPGVNRWSKMVDGTGTVDEQVQAGKLLRGIATHEVIMVDQKASGTSGGAFTAGEWRVRDLNTMRLDTTKKAAISENQFRLPKGTWSILALVPAYQVGKHQARIWDTVKEVSVLAGAAGHSTSSVSYSVIVGTLSVVDAGRMYEVQHRGTSTVATGFGSAGNFGEVETYTIVRATRRR